jgi:hypothetical protein
MLTVRFMDKNFLLSVFYFQSQKKEQRFLPILKDWVSALSQSDEAARRAAQRGGVDGANGTNWRRYGGKNREQRVACGKGIGMRLIFFLLVLAVLGVGAWHFGNTHPDLRNKVVDVITKDHFHTLEIRYTAAHIMEAHQRELLKDNRHQFLEPQLKFYPYLLMEVKYSMTEDKTHEGVILWDLTDGEMVIDTKDWDKTHGFGDCIKANTTKQEFKILNLLARKGGVLDRDALHKSLRVENDILDAWIDSCRKKQLIVQTGNRYRLHLQNPRLKTLPETRIDEKLVTTPYKNTLLAARRFSDFQIERITKAAFGNDFAIRKMTDVYLPVHSIVVQNPDGSVHTSHWNALNGKRLSRSHFAD